MGCLSKCSSYLKLPEKLQIVTIKRKRSMPIDKKNNKKQNKNGLTF